MSYLHYTSLLCVFCILLSAASGCNRTAPGDLVDEEDYISILVEMHLLAAIRELDGDEKRYSKGQERVLAHYDISREQFQRSHTHYHRNMQQQQERYREVRRRLDELGTNITDRYFELRDTLAAPYIP